MRTKKLSRLLAALLCGMTLLLSPVRATADLGPKPSLHISIVGAREEPCFATLLIQGGNGIPSLGGNETFFYRSNDDVDSIANPDVWKAFTDYKDAKNFYFSYRYWDLSKVDEIYWGYFAPETFKILLYYPESEAYALSAVYDRYAFDSYFTVNLETSFRSPEERAGSKGQQLPVETAYNYLREFLSLVARIILTIAIELLIALPFGYRRKRQIKRILRVNVATQLALNVLLNAIGANCTGNALAMSYACLEILILAIEALVYQRFLRDDGPGTSTRGRAIA